MSKISIYGLRMVKESTAEYKDIPTMVCCQYDAYKAMNTILHMDERAEEVLGLMTLNTKNCITGTFIVSQGNLNNSIVHPREVFKRALLNNSASIIVAHNHPSGDISPSNEDLAITKRLVDAGRIIGIPLLDHIIIGQDGEYISLKKEGVC